MERKMYLIFKIFNILVFFNNNKMELVTLLYFTFFDIH